MVFKSILFLGVQFYIFAFQYTNKKVKKLISSTIKNLLFDLGGVIINIDVPRVAQHFSQLTGNDLTSIGHKIKEKNIFGLYERGVWTDEQFSQQVCEMLGCQLSHEQICQAWNSLLLDIPKERVDLLKALREKYNLYLLSNTNPIHIREVNVILQKSSGVASLEELFDKTYYSYDIRQYKPFAEAYQYVLQDSNLIAAETIFIDDNYDNIAGAQSVGMQTIHIQSPATILDHFTNA